MYLITGGSGSLGTAITKELLPQSKVRVFSNDEYQIWQMRQVIPDKRLDLVIGDVRDKNALYDAMRGVRTVIHCAALKHVPFCEDNPIEAVKINILGSINVIECAKEYNLYKVIAISTDKAVSPRNIYGATKMIMEGLFLKAGYTCIRFPNFKESRGNVFEIWKNGKTLPITDERVSRYFISIRDASQFTCMVADRANGGEIFFPKCSSQLLINLAKEMYPNKKIEIIGLRPGEKLEEIFFENGQKPIDNGDCWVLR